MMGAPSLPVPQGAMPAGFTAFLANIGQLPDGCGESPSFDALLAAAPVAAAPVAGTAATIAVAPAPLPVPAGDAIAAQGEVRRAKADADAGADTNTGAAVVAEAAVAKSASGEADAAAALAANLLIALTGSAAGRTAAPGKPAPVRADSETAPDAAKPGDASPVNPGTDWAAIVAAAVPAAAKPVQPAPSARSSEAPAALETGAAPAAPRPRDAAPPMPVIAGAEAPAAKPVEAAPSMTILFAQPAAQGAAMRADAAAPVAGAERVLDMDSDGAWIDQLARDIAATKSDGGDIRFRLMPRHLGRLDVAMQIEGDSVALKLDTHHEATATIVTAAQGRLIDELRQQGVRVAGAEVTCTPGETGRQSQGQGQARAGAPDPAHLIETATERAEPRDEERAADRRGRFA